MKNRLLPGVLLVLGAVLLDAVVGPILLNGRSGFHFTAGAVIVVGLRENWTWGLVAGWTGGLLLASLSSEPAGMTMLSLGLAGAAGGLLSGIFALHFMWLNGLILFLLLLAEDVLAGLLARGIHGVEMHFGWLGCLCTTFVMLAVVALAPRRDWTLMGGAPPRELQPRGRESAEQ